MKFEKKPFDSLDLLKLPADGVLEAISEMIGGNAKNTITLGDIIIKKIGTIALDQEKERVILSGESENKQGLLVSFGVRDNPVIHPTIRVIGAEKKVKKL